MASPGTATTNNLPHTKVTREDWINAALDTLISDGVERVKVLDLARKLEVSRSSFYWYFKSRQDLLDELLEHWRGTNTAAIVERAGRTADTIVRGVLNVFECWVDPDLFDPRLDFAVREWARRSGTVRRVVDMADDQRVKAIAALYETHGFGETDAFVRARILYFMQIGYYALDLAETNATRLSLVEAYARGFTGEQPTTEEMAEFIAFVEGLGDRRRSAV